MVVDNPAAELDRLFRALADATRRDIVRRTLVAACSVSALAAQYDMSFAAVQKHVAVLERAGLVQKSAQGRTRLVTAVPDRIARVQACLRHFEALWRHRMNALDELLAEAPEE
jgi:DNA-binding transcriptional ArsR family regulator